MTLEVRAIRRLFVGKEVGKMLAILLAGSFLISGGFVPTYLAVLFASGVRNAHFAWLGSGVLFYAVAFVFLYLEAVALTAVYFAIRYAYQTLRGRFRNEASA